MHPLYLIIFQYILFICEALAEGLGPTAYFKLKTTPALSVTGLAKTECVGTLK